MAIALPTDLSAFEIVLFVLSVTLTTLGLLTVGGIARWFFSQHKRYATFRKKFWLFPIFIAGIFAIGAVSAAAQQLIYAYLKQNIATSISGFLITILVAWFLYDWAIWRSHR